MAVRVLIIESLCRGAAAGPVLADSLGCATIDTAAAAVEVVGTGVDNSWRDSSKENESKTLSIVSQVHMKDDEML